MTTQSTRSVIFQGFVSAWLVKSVKADHARADDAAIYSFHSVKFSFGSGWLH
jgi:hypothetical protein